MKVSRILCGVGAMLGGALLAYGVNALTFQDSVNVLFSFDVSLGITLSSGDLMINGLMPGNASYSNTITATVATNSAYGYTLSAMVGGTGETVASNALYNSAAGTSFTSLASDANIALSNFQENNWGYTTAASINGNTKYSGLIYNTGKTINKTTSYDGTAADGYAGTDSTSFTIGAKAAPTQVSGDYSNVITFAVVSNAAPPPYMQDLDSSNIAIWLPSIGSTTVAIDKRDGQEYVIGRLADGKVWMLENLNLAGGTALSADDTDVTSEYISGFVTNNGLTKEGNTIVLPASAVKNNNSNDLVDNTQFSSNINAYVFNSGNKTDCGASGQNAPCGSYYSYVAATLGRRQSDGTTAETRQGYNAAASICPKGWRLPTSTTSNASAQSDNNWKTGDFYALATAYGANLETVAYDNDSATSGNFYNNAGPGTAPNFLLGGYYDLNLFNYGGEYGYYWSATLYSSTNAYTMRFGSGYIAVSYIGERSDGRLVRCVLR